MRFSSFVLLLVFWTFSYSQSALDGVSIQVDYSSVFNETEPYIKNMPHQVGEYKALDGTQFTEDRWRKPLQYRLPLSLTVAKTFKTEKENVFSVGIRYGRYSLTDTLGYRLRYTDMLGQNGEGFVNPSNYTLESGHYLYHTLGATMGYAVEDKVGMTIHRFGASFSVERLVKSNYYLNHISTKRTDYADTDLTLKDKMWFVAPSVNYSTNVLSRTTEKWWLAASFRFNMQSKYENTPLGHIATFGVQRYL